MNLVMIAVYIPSPPPPPPPPITRPPRVPRGRSPTPTAKEVVVAAASRQGRPEGGRAGTCRRAPRNRRGAGSGGTRVPGLGFTAKPDCVTFVWLSLLMDIDEPRTPKLADMRSRGPHKHWCKVCTKNFPSGRALGGHMTCHRLAGMQPRSTPSPPVIVVDLPVSLLGSSDEKPSLTSLETKCLHCSKEFSTCQSLRGNMQMHSAKKVMTKPDEEPAGLMGVSANANGYHGHKVMLFSPVKRKRSKRGMPALDSEEMCAAATLLMLAEDSDKSSVYENCCKGDNNDNISTPNLLKEVNLNAFDRLSQPDEFLNNTRPKSDKNSAYEGFYDFSEKENNLNLAADVPKKMRSSPRGLIVSPAWLSAILENTSNGLESFECQAQVSPHNQSVSRSFGFRFSILMDINKPRTPKYKGQMILKDPSDDYPWLSLTLGPSERAVEEYMRMNKVEDDGGEQGVLKTPRIHLRSKGGDPCGPK
ncbi:hypothetical protein C2845_PM05G03750 [Panicum miliaceum]|uniref:C2H2-type domain-containing protein n=1 Tax=Panicum miliaceum TaxID=4540 RepID=A0A3L6T4W8_PANMI|nr:hypothetical protein C2845_PM05G03750 [Panicum miliaceum]